MANIASADRVGTKRLGAMVGGGVPMRDCAPVAGVLLLASLAAACTHQSSDTARADLLLDPSRPEWTRPSPPVWRARFETSKGDFIVEAAREHAPIGVDRFYTRRQHPQRRGTLRAVRAGR